MCVYIYIPSIYSFFPAFIYLVITEKMFKYGINTAKNGNISGTRFHFVTQLLKDFCLEEKHPSIF